MAKDLQYWKILTRLFGEATKHIKRRPPLPSTPVKSIASSFSSYLLSPSPSSPSPSPPPSPAVFPVNPISSQSLPLVTEMEEIVSSSFDLNFTLLLSGSNSSAPYWDDLKSIVSTLTTKLAGAEIQVIQYSTTSRTECPFTRNSDSLQKSIKGNVPTTTFFQGCHRVC